MTDIEKKETIYFKSNKKNKRLLISPIM